MKAMGWPCAPGALAACIVAATWLAPPAGVCRAAEPTAAAIQQQTGIRTGLAVHVGSTDGQLEAELAQGGRVSGKPLLTDGRAIFGCHDGWVYALRASDGSLLWRSLVAPYERYTAAYGQIESTWPVYGVALHEGAIVASAGRHPEISGGVHVASLDPDTGVAAWRRVLVKPPAQIVTANGKTQGNIVPRSFLNAAPAVENGMIQIGGFAFAPAEADDVLQKRLNTNPVRKTSGPPLRGGLDVARHSVAD